MGAAIARGWLGLLALLVVLVAGAAPALAHSDLTSSDPADGAVLAEAPDSVSFTFNEKLLAQGNAIILTEVDTETRLELGSLDVEGDTVRAAWPAASPAGRFRADYRVVSADGHPIDGAIRFTVEAALAPPAPDPAADDASGSPSPTAEPIAEPATPAASPEPVAVEDRQAGVGVLTWVLVVGIVLLAGAALGTWYTRRNP